LRISRVRVRLLILLPCAAAILASLVAGSVVAANQGRAQAGASSTIDTPGAYAQPLEATSAPTVASLDESSGARTPTPAPPSANDTQVWPVPQEVLPSTNAGALAGPGTLLRSQPTPQPHRQTIILDPGHGRGDPGAVHHAADGQTDVTEADVNLDIADNLRHFLENEGYDVYVTRSGFGKPLALGPLTPSLITGDLMNRVGLADAVEGDLFISIHNNGSPNPEASGTEIWYCGQNTFGEQSARLAGAIYDAAIQALAGYGYDTVQRGTQEDATEHSQGFCQFLVTREVQMPAILTELLFLTNDADAAVLKDPLARESLADHMAQAIDEFLQGN
jgi:N-acetylmuramoyl-L-alanine amidase